VRIVVSAGLIVSLPAAEQTPAQPLVRVNVELLQVEAVVTDSDGRRVPDLRTDSDGRRVPDLRPEDFQLLVDGKEKNIAYFSFVDAGRKSAAATAQVAHTPRREEVHRTVVFMIDEVHTSPENIGLLAPVVRRFADEQVSPGDLISVMATRSNMGIYERFTSDPRRIRAAMERLVRLVGQNYDRINHQDRPGSDRAGLIGAANAYFMETYHGVAMAALARAIEGLREMPGRKAIVLFSDGIEFPLSQLTPVLGQQTDPAYVKRMEERTRQIADLANRAGVVFYTFDAKGVSVASVLELDPRRRASLQTVPYFLAKETGGLFVHDTDSLSAALGKAMEDMTGYYLLGYSPAPEEIDGMRGDDRNRRIRVKVQRNGLNVRTRTSFGLLPGNAPAEPQTREDLMRRALFSPFAAGTIGMRLSPVYSASPPDPKTGARRSLLRALLSVDGRDLRVRTGDDGKKAVVLDVAAVAFDANNKVVISKDQRHTIELPERQASGLDDWISYQIEIAIPKPGAYEIRAAVRDEEAAATGSAGTFVEVPDFNKQRFALSSLVLSESEEGEDAGARRAKTASRNFRIGQRIDYGFQVYGARSGKPGGTQVEVELRLFRDGAQVFASNLIPIAPDPGAKELTVVGSFVVPASFAEGEYTMQMMAHDKLADPKKGTASQWIDLTLSK
jgi:VWFA-related protein